MLSSGVWWSRVSCASPWRSPDKGSAPHILLENPDGVAPDSDTRSVSSGGGVPTPCTRRQSPLRCSTFSGYLTFGILSDRLSTHLRISYIRNSIRPTFHPSPDILHLEFYMVYVPPSLDISHPAPDAGWERRAFQLPRLDISGSSNSAYPESLAAILHSAAVFSWSFMIFPTEFLRYFALDIWCLNPQTLLVTHLS